MNENQSSIFWIVEIFVWKQLAAIGNRLTRLVGAQALADQ